MHVHLAQVEASSAASRAGAASRGAASSPCGRAGPLARAGRTRGCPARASAAPSAARAPDRRGATTRRSATRRSSRATALRGGCAPGAASGRRRRAPRAPARAARATSSSNSPITCTIATSSLPIAFHCATRHGAWCPSASFDACADLRGVGAAVLVLDVDRQCAGSVRRLGDRDGEIAVAEVDHLDQAVSLPEGDAAPDDHLRVAPQLRRGHRSRHLAAP